MFRPPFCPNPDCTAHHGPLDRFYRRSGWFRPKCRKRPVARFICRHCGRAFSAQTFELDYRDHRPDLNSALFARVMRGQSLRRTPAARQRHF